MKTIEAIIKPHKLEDGKLALTQVGIRGLTATEVRGFGRQKGHKEQYRGAEYTVDLVPKVKVEVVVCDSAVISVTEAIIRAARTDEIGAGKIFVSKLELATRIRTGEKGEAGIGAAHNNARYLDYMTQGLTADEARRRDIEDGD